MGAEFCVCCGAVIPEGLQTCYKCEKISSKKSESYDDDGDCSTLTDSTRHPKSTAKSQIKAV